MTKVVLSPDAVADLRGIWRHIAKDSDYQAGRYVTHLTAKLRVLSIMPGIGRLREDVGQRNVRSYPVHSHVVLYRHGGDVVDVLRIVHGARDIRRIRLP